MYSREEAIKIKSKIKKYGVFLWKKDMDVMKAIETEFYFYGSEQERNNHIKQQEELGWIYNEMQNIKKPLYNNFLIREDNVFVYTAYFERCLKPINWD